jgi:serine/threonine protein kinase
MDQYDVHRSVRDTLFGKVLFGEHRATKTPVAIKVFDKELMIKRTTRAGQPIAENAQDELRIHAALCSGMTHPNIVKIHDFQEDASQVYAVLEFCSGGDFFSLVSKHKRLRAEIASRYFAQLSAAVFFLHERNVCHRDLSLENILLDAKLNLKICDFGVACDDCEAGSMQANDEPARRVGKPSYMAPEVFALQPYDSRCVDVWASGVIL